MDEYGTAKKQFLRYGIAAAAFLLALLILFPPDLTAQTADTADMSLLAAGPENAVVPEPAESDPAETEPAVPEEPPVSKAEALLSTMTLREKLCQMFIVMPEGLTGDKGLTFAGEGTRTALSNWPVGGILYDKSNLRTKDQVRGMLARTQSYSAVPLILTCDEEGGRVSRLMTTVGTTYFSPMLRFKDQGTDTAFSHARTIGADMVSCGFNMDLAPVADVWSNRKNTVIGDRAYSDDFHQAAELIGAAVAGFHEGGVACTLKHFPGHGDTYEDSHSGLAKVYKTLDQIREQELLPFASGINAGADAVMIGHLLLPEVDSEPATFSYRIVTELLRGELGFTGVVITDSLQMGAMTENYGGAEAAVRAVEAGCDILLDPVNLHHAVEALLNAVWSGRISEERIDASVLRILTLKETRGIL